MSIYTRKYNCNCINNKKIPLYKGRDNKKILYISGVALWLSKSQNRKAIEFANVIASYLSATCNDAFSVQIVPPGWIHLELTHPTLAAWLQSLVAGVQEEDKEKYLITGGKPEFSDSLFAIQYAHARCFSLVLIAHQEGLIKLREPVSNTSRAFWSIVSSNPIPWLNSDKTLRLNHPSENSLIAELIQVVDNMEIPDVNDSVNWEKAALNLSQAFDNFWCNCQIWGEVKTRLPELAQARVGLLIATQLVLRSVLEEKIGIFAPLEL